MEQREVYIVRASHSDANSIPSLFDLEALTRSHRSVIATAKIIHDIAVAELITGFFGDGITKSVAKEMNDEIKKDPARKKGGLNEFQRAGSLSLGGFFNVK